MPTRIAEYYTELQQREGLEPMELVGPWDQGTPDRISQAFRAGMTLSRLLEQQIPLRERSSNQSIGNQVADFFVPAINAHIQDYRIEPCPGGGYPDKLLFEIASNRIFAFELKATSTWNETDSNRRVLTSSSRKLRQHFAGAANHVLATILYSTENLRSRVLSLRLDFIEPDTFVNIRLEASVSHRLLTEATHTIVTIPQEQREELLVGLRL